jgi:hypothetical protein
MQKQVANAKKKGIITPWIFFPRRRLSAMELAGRHHAPVMTASEAASG